MKKLLLCTVLIFSGVLMPLENSANAEPCTPTQVTSGCSTIILDHSKVTFMQDYEKKMMRVAHTPCGTTGKEEILFSAPVCVKMDRKLP